MKLASLPDRVLPDGALYIYVWRGGIEASFHCPYAMNPASQQSTETKNKLRWGGRRGAVN